MPKQPAIPGLRDAIKKKQTRSLSRNGIPSIQAAKAARKMLERAV